MGRRGAKHALAWIRTIAPVIAVGCAAGAVESRQADRPPAGERVHYVLAGEGNEARYRVREQLVGFDFPNDAVGVTEQVTGVLVLVADGTIAADLSRFTVDLASIRSDNDRRDNFVQRNTLKTDEFPTAVFVPRSAPGLPFPLPAMGELRFELVGELTIHGETRPVTWEVVARVTDGAIRGTASTQFDFATFGLTIPRVRSVLSIRDNIRLEYDFHFVRQVL